MHASKSSALDHIFLGPWVLWERNETYKKCHSLARKWILPHFHHGDVTVQHFSFSISDQNLQLKQIASEFQAMSMDSSADANLVYQNPKNKPVKTTKWKCLSYVIKSKPLLHNHPCYVKEYNFDRAYPFNNLWMATSRDSSILIGSNCSSRSSGNIFNISYYNSQKSYMYLSQ